MQFLFFWRKKPSFWEEEARQEQKKYTKKGERKYKYLQSKIIRFYHIAFVLTALVLLATFSIAVINAGKFNTEDSGSGAKNQLRLAGTEMFLADRTYRPNTHSAEFLFQIKREPIYQKQPMQMVVAEKKTRQKLPSKLIELNEEYMLVVVQDIPEKWKEIVIDIGENELYVDTNSEVKTDYLLTKDKSEIVKTGEWKQGAFHFSKEKTPSKNISSPLDEEGYLRYYAERQVQAADRLADGYEADMDRLNQNIKHMDKQIASLESDKKYQTDKQQEMTNSDIKSIKGQQEGMRGKLSEMKLGIKQLMARKGKLVEWLRDHPA